MANLYFCQPHAKNQGMLRAILTLAELETMAREHQLTYIGSEFPILADSQEADHDFALLGVRSEETTPALRQGYYRIESDINSINEALLKLAR
jgi:hypothetical protein